jgi:hypothetical protein
MLQHQFLGNALVRTPGYQQYQLFGFHPDGPGIHTIPHATFSAANLHVNHLRPSNGRNAKGEGGQERKLCRAMVTSEHKFSPQVQQTMMVAATPAKFVAEILS